MQMGQYRLDSIARLATQMRFAPIARRLQQLHAAEDLLLTLKPDQTYSINQITCAITGYEPKHTDGVMLTGVALQHDLGMLIEQTSESLQLHIAAVPEPVLGIEDIVQRLGVTSKTVQRWRRRGLPAGRYTFTDGKRRVGFRLGHVQRFAQGAPVEDRPAAATGNTQRDLAWLIAHAEKLAQRGYWRKLAAERLAKAAGVSAPALDRLLAEHGPDIAFAVEPDATQRRMVMKATEGEQSLSEIAARLSMPKFGVYRMVLDRKLHRAIRKKISFVDDPLYHGESPLGAIEAIIAQEPVESVSAQAMDRIPHELPPYLKELYRIPLLSKARERGLFLKYQYFRFCCAQAQQQLDLQASHQRDLNRLLHFRRLARQVRGHIVEANLRLVVSVARKHVRAGLPLMDLISEGNLILIRAVGSFDVHRGTRFSTYAVYALMRGFARYVPTALGQQSSLADPAMLAEVRDPASTRQQDEAVLRDEVDNLVTKLNQRERDIITQRYGLQRSQAPLSCEQLGTRLRVSRQRITQIEQQAIQKLRGVAR